MKLFMSIVLCFSAAVAEAIPEPFSALDSMQSHFYNMAVRAAKKLQQSKVTSFPNSSLKTKMLSAEIMATKARSDSLYGNEPGYMGVTDRVVTSEDGQRFLYINIKGDGNCGFYASGVSRATFVATIQDLINESHDPYQAFLKDRDDCLSDVENSTLSDDMAGMAGRLKHLADSADNGDTMIGALKLVTDFKVEKNKYQAELFQDCRSDLIVRLKEFSGVSSVQTNVVLLEKINTMMNRLASASYDDPSIRELIVGASNEIIIELRKMKVSSHQFEYKLKEIVEILDCSEEELFKKAKARLKNKIQNLMTFSSYESFLEALRLELIAGKLPEKNLVSKAEILDSVGKIFSLNLGARAWFPGGFLGALKDKLGIKYNIWRRVNGDIISLYSSSADSQGIPEKGDNVRDMLFTGGHYDMLIPINAISDSD